ncbi:QcrA and Rieske domain-containing protein [Lignipirellula cremea]|uniref:QcrA and Rieske domain-containing protein n=1 Tax=Lignipirellula cremea TaxID=2528010 RepID=UPI0011A45EA8|nr:Rieske 2Fe-2S domain-containing protein [Lignipirellula cremea]
MVDAPAPGGPTRRSLIWELAAGFVGFVVGLPALGAGMLVLFDPLFRREAIGANGPGKWLRITSLESVPADNTPAQFPVLDDLVDAWNRDANQPIGAIFLLRKEDGEIKAFNASCPHAGCFVSYAAAHDVFACPCHNSEFELDGSKVKGKSNPSPRPLDALEVDPEKLKLGEVWVKFINYYPGIHDLVPKG